MTNTIPFFLINRELAGLVLDHLDHKTIRTFRLVCKSANACARSAFLRTSTRARLSEITMLTAFRKRTLCLAVGCDRNCPGLRCTSAPVSVAFMRDKMAYWEVVVVESLSGLLTFSRDLEASKNLVAPRVVTVALEPRFLQDYNESPRCDRYFGDRAFTVFASRVKPRHLCIGKHDVDWFTPALKGFMEQAAWPLKGVAYHWRLSNTDRLIPNIANHHIFCHRERSDEESIDLRPFRAEDVAGVETITYYNRPLPFIFKYPNDTRTIPADYFKASVKNFEVRGPGGTPRYCFPGNGPVLKCPCCGFEV